MNNQDNEFSKEILLRALNAYCISPACDRDSDCDKCRLDDMHTTANGQFTMSNKFLNVLYALIEKEMAAIKGKNDQ